MSNSINASTLNVASQDAQMLRKSWGWLFALGVLYLVGGFIGLGMEVVLTMSTVVFFGMVLIIGGVFQVVQSFVYYKGWKSVIFYLLMALAYGFAGVMMVANPVAASTILTLIIGSALIMVGVCRMVIAFQSRPAESWGWMLVSSIVSMIAGVMILMSWPSSGLWVIGTIVAVELIMAGFANIKMALMLKNIEGVGMN